MIALRPVHPPPARRRTRAAASRLAGVTLVELVVTLAVVGTLVALGVPSFVHLLASHAIAAQAEALQDAVRLGRNEAMKRGGPVVLCRADARAAGRCAGSGGDWQAWLLFADLDRNGTFETGDMILRQQLEVSRLTSVAGEVASVRFESTGIAHSDGGQAIDFSFAAAGASPGPAGSGRSAQRRVCVNPRGEGAIVVGAGPCP